MSLEKTKRRVLCKKDQERGLGTATAKLLHRQGARIALLYAPFEAGRRDSVLATHYGSSTSTKLDRITTHECDITSERSVTSTFDSLPVNCTDAFPSILVNAAGYVSVADMEDTSSEEALKNLTVNIMGPFLCSRAFHALYRRYRQQILDQPDSAQMEEKHTTGHSTSSAMSNTEDGGRRRRHQQVPPGRIVSISSQAAHIGLHGHSAYCASKAGLNGLTRCMANEWGPQGITVNTISPTVVLTDLGRKAWSDERKRKEMEAQIPVGRFAVPEEIASAIEWLCRDESGMVNGADVRIDGGFSIR